MSSIGTRAPEFSEVSMGWKWASNTGSWTTPLLLAQTFRSSPRSIFLIPFETEDGSELMLPLEWHRDWSHFGLTAEVGHIWVNGKSKGWEGGVGAALFLEPITLLGEWHTGVREAPFDLRDPMVNVGLTWEWSEAVSFFFSMGKSLHSHEEETNSWRLAGFQFRF
jgi:hypothetical protein